MAINLQKGQTIDLRKNDKGETFDLSTVTIGLGWDVKQKDSGFFGKLFGGVKEEEYDLDAIAFLLDSNGKVANLGRTANVNGRQVGLYEGDIIFFNSLNHPSGKIWLTGDNRTGEGDGDDEQIIVKLDSLDEKYKKIIFLVTIYQGKQNNQHFGLVENAFIRAVDAKGKEIAKFNLSGDSSLNGMCAMVFAEAYRKDNEWKFRAIGEPKHTDNFVDILKSYT
jgi:stress response protein SCP2